MATDFRESFSAWWDATVDVTKATINVTADALEHMVYGDQDEENIKLIMTMKHCDEPTARAYYAQYKIEQNPSAKLVDDRYKAGEATKADVEKAKD